MPQATDIYYHIYEGGEEGQRPPVVLIHGAGGNHLSWPSEVRRLPGYQVYSIDLPGHGRSGGRGQQSIIAYSQSVLEWLEAVGLHRAVFIGHSMGSAIALQLAIEHSQHVLALGLIGGGARLRVAAELIESTASSTTFHNAIDAIIANSFSPETPAGITDAVTKRMAENRPSVLHADFLACDAFDETERAAEIVQPTLVIVGSEDRMTPVRYSQFLTSALPNARLEIIPGAGHMVMLERPQAVAGVIKPFLDEISY